MLARGLPAALYKRKGLVCLALLVVYFIFRINAFVHIFFTHAGTLLTQTEIADAYRDGAFDPEAAVVPRIIHQIFHNWTHPEETTLPVDWSRARQTCLDLHPDWQHWLWTEKHSHEFIANNYPEFLDIYENFKFPVQKIDALRYFLMLRYGGIYVDLDNGCTANLEPLRYYPTWVTDGGKGALSNNILGAEPNHPFWIFLTDSMPWYAWNYPLPYLTISYATGQWFETVMWEKYHAGLRADEPGLLRVSMDGAEDAPAWVFFNHNRGGTWDNWDNRMFAWIGDHLFIVAAGAAVLMVLLVGLGRYAVRKMQGRMSRETMSKQ